MQKLDYPKGWHMHTGFHHAGEFYILLTNMGRNERWGGVNPKWRLVNFSGTVNKECVGSASNYRREPIFFSHPDHPGVNVCGAKEGQATKIKAENVQTGKKFDVSLENPPVWHGDAPEGYTGPTVGYWEYKAWFQTHMCVLTHHRYQNVRAVWNDSLIVMTGKEASSRASLVMGPREAASVLETKGLENGYVLAYQRGGGHRLMKPGKHYLTHLALAEDGLVFMACTTSNGAYLIDFDIQ